MVKMTQKGKKTPESLTCRFCANDLPDTQEHLEICDVMGQSLRKGSEGQLGDGRVDFLEDDGTEDDSEDCYSNLNTRHG